jgi:sigma-B regulation protein RsbU (phosphoserine phosphatase)
MARRIVSTLLWRSTLPGIAVSALLAISGLVLGATSLPAQTFDATSLDKPTQLGMPWLIHAGDDPAYARADFDDSGWTLFDPYNSLTTVYGRSRPSVVWYRLHLKVSPSQTGLALSEFSLANAFEIFANGQKVITNGRMSPFAPYTMDAHLIRPIPDAAIATGSVVIAMRVHISSLEWSSGYPAFYPNNLELGEWNALNDHVWLNVIGSQALAWFSGIAGIGLGIVAFALYSAQRRRREYLWIFLLYFCFALGEPLELYRLFHTVPTAWEFVRQPVQIAYLLFLTLTYYALLSLRMERWLKIYLVAAAVGMAASMIMIVTGVGSSLSAFLAFAPEMGVLSAIIPGMLFTQWRRGNREAGILLFPALFLSLNIYVSFAFFLAGQIPAWSSASMRIFMRISTPTLGPFVLDLGALSNTLFVLSLGMIIVLRSTRISRQQAETEAEMAAAREVQQVILPEQIETIPGFQVDAVYKPAQQVGGDFFQILPASEGALLLVVGDVAGKGLPAAMLVSVLVGAVRGVAEYTSDPAELLANLNERLIGRANGGFSTALVARISAAGEVAIANAGHLPPYLNGKEVSLPGELPLGVKSGVHYETTRFPLAVGARLTFFSDGIVEAQNARGELLGFERSRELSIQPVAAIVEAATRFGQHDDITVVAITREEPPAPLEERRAAALAAGKSESQPLGITAGSLIN